MNTNLTINHRFLNSDFFFPTWGVDTLILGTFNPTGGNGDADYFYGRRKNNFWKAIANCIDLELKYFDGNLDRKLEIMKTHRFGCVDIIKSIDVKHQADIENIKGNGYSDSLLFTKKRVLLTYQFEEIKQFISERGISKIIYTWGKRMSPKSFELKILDLKSFCSKNKITFIENCPSPSGRLRGQKNFEGLVSLYSKELLTKK